MALEHLKFTTNRKARVRHETLEGRNHLVVPMVMLTEGVHAGSGGPLFYPKEELQRNVNLWDHKPIVVYHPEMDGKGISACQPDVINRQKIGVILNTQWKSKLRGEAWLDVERMESVDSRVSDAVENNRMMEVSTGLFTDNDPTPGTFNGKAYDFIARNYRPDHLAVLPDQIGACSIADGAGLLQMNSKNKPEEFVKWLRDAGLISNEMSHGQIRDRLSNALSDYFVTIGADRWDGWIEEVYGSFFIYWRDGSLYRLSYLHNDTKVELSGDPEAVERVTQYRLVSDGSIISNQLPSQENPEMDKDKIVNELIANAATQWTEEDRKTLMGMEVAVLNKLSPKPVTNANTPPAATTVPPATTEEPKGTPVANEAPKKPQTVEEYINNAPPELRDALVSQYQTHQDQKNQVIATITANKKNVFTPEVLNAMPIAQLKAIAALAEQEQAPQTMPLFNAAPPIFTGAAAPAPTTNQSSGLAVEALVPPVMNFGPTEK